MEKIQKIKQCIKTRESLSLITNQDTLTIYYQSDSPFIIDGKEGFSAFNYLAEKIFEKDDIQLNYTLDDVKKTLFKIIVDDIDNSIMADDKAKLLCKNKLKTSSQEKFTFYFPIFGIKLIRSCQFSSFSFSLRHRVYKSFENSELRRRIKDIDSDYFIGLDIISATENRAYQLVDQRLEIVEHLFAFLIGRKFSGYEVRILRAPHSNIYSRFCKSNIHESYGWRNENHTDKILDLSDSFFKKNIIKSCFKIIGQSKPSIMETRIKNAIIWIGQGLKSLNSSQSILYYTIAMESLLMRNSGFISPSIVAQLSEQCVFLLGKKYEDRTKIESYVKKVYSKRSAIAHGGTVSENKHIENLALELVTNLTFKFIELYNKQIDNDEKLKTFIDKQKYGN